MTPEQSYRNPLALTAMLISAVPFLSALAMLAVRFGIGPAALMYMVAQIGGAFMFGLIVIGSGLAVASLARADGRHDWRIYTALLMQGLSVAASLLFLKNA